MIITLEGDGQPRLDSISDKKVPFDILLPEQTYFPDYPGHSILRNINHGRDASISTACDSRCTLTEDSRHPYSYTSNLRRLLKFPFLTSSSIDPLMSGSTVVEKPGKTTALAPSWNKKWLIGWVLLSLMLCTGVACGVWIAEKRVDRNLLVQTLNSDWAVDEVNVFTQPPEQFGCDNDPAHTVVNGFVFKIPPGLSNDHTFLIRGGASGHLTIASSPDSKATSIIYDVVLHGSRASLDTVVFDEPGPVTGASTAFTINTPNLTADFPPETSPCMRFEITMYVPESLNKLAINTTTPTQLTFSSQAHVQLESLVIGLANTHPKTRVDVSESLNAKAMYIETQTGCIHGIISIGDSLEITNWSGRIEVEVVPNVMDILNPPTAVLTTTTTSGKVDIRYLRNTGYRKRTIASCHTMGIVATSSGQFDYGYSGFNGLLYINSTEYNITNAGGLKPPPPPPPPPPPLPRGLAVDNSWPIVVGNQTGQDKIHIISGRGTIFLSNHP